MEKSEDLLSKPIQYVKGVGPRLSELLERKGVRTIEDALYFLPRCYEDRRTLKKISDLKAGSRETGYGEILISGGVYSRHQRRRGFEAVVADGSGKVVLKWFRGNERVLRKRFQKGSRLVFSGEVEMV